MHRREGMVRRGQGFLLPDGKRHDRFDAQLYVVSFVRRAEIWLFFVCSCSAWLKVCYFGKKKYDIDKKRNGEVIEKLAILIERVILINYVLV